MAADRADESTGGVVGGDARGDTAAPAPSRAGVPLPPAPPPNPERLQRMHARGMGDAWSFLADRAPRGSDAAAWLLGVAGVFAQRLLPMLQERQKPLRVTVAVRLPWRARLRLLRTGRLKVDLALPYEAPHPARFGQPLLALESGGTGLKAELDGEPTPVGVPPGAGGAE